jgi:hypothetical protein
MCFFRSKLLVVLTLLVHSFFCEEKRALFITQNVHYNPEQLIALHTPATDHATRGMSRTFRQLCELMGYTILLSSRMLNNKSWEFIPSFLSLPDNGREARPLIQRFLEDLDHTQTIGF